MIEKIRKVVELLGYTFFFGTRDEVYAYINRVRTCVAVYRQGNATGASQSLVFKFKGDHPHKMYYDVFAELKKVLTIGVQRTFFYDDVLEVRCPVMAKTMEVGSYVKRTPDYLRFTAQGSATISMTNENYTIDEHPVIEISANGKNWETWNFTIIDGYWVADVISLNDGETVMMRGNNTNGTGGYYLPDDKDYEYFSFVITGNVSASGDVNVLMDGVGGKSTTLANNCYSHMFYGCTGLTSAPVLPATTLAEGCYFSMFYGCTGLTSAPVLPATALAEDCYFSMFYGCTGLTSAPVLPATALAEGCYNSMFEGCTGLTGIEVHATEWNTSSTYNWVNGVSATGTFRKTSGTTIPTGTSGIPSGWTVINV